MAQTDMATPRAASWELVCSSLYSPEERTSKLGDPPLTQRSIDEVFLFCALRGILFRFSCDYEDLRKRLHSGGFSTNLVALKTLPRTEAGEDEAYRRAKLAFQHYNYEDEVDQDKSNNHSSKKINVCWADLLTITNNSIDSPFAPEIRLRHDMPLYYSSDDLPQVVSPQWYILPTDIPDPFDVDKIVDNCESGNIPSELSHEAIPWEVVCRAFYTPMKKKAMLGYPPLTKRSIDEVFLFRALIGKLLSSYESEDLWKKLVLSGIIVNPSALTVTTLARTEAYGRAKRAFRHDSYDDEDEVDQDKSNYQSNRKINLSWPGLINLTSHAMYIKPFAPEISLRKDIPLYYSRDDLPQLLGVCTRADMPHHDDVDKTVETSSLELSMERISWERICRDLYDAENREAMLGYPPLTKKSIDEVFLFRALTGKIFVATYDCDDLWKRLVAIGITVNLSALKTLPQTEAGVQEAYRRAKQAFQNDNYDDEDEVDPDKSNNHSYKKIKVSFMELVKIADDSIVKRFAPEARLRQHSTVYYSTLDSSEVDSSQCDDAPFGNPRHGDVDKTVPAYCGAGNRPLDSSMDLPSTLDSPCSVKHPEKDALITTTHSVDLLKTTEADTKSNSYRRFVPSTNEGIKLASQLGQSISSDTLEVEHLSMAIALVDDTVKIPQSRYQRKTMFWKIVIVLVISAAHGLLWKLLRRNHGFTVRGHRYNPQLRDGLAMENINSLA